MATGPGATRRSLLRQATSRIAVALVLAMAIIVIGVGWLYMTTLEAGARVDLDELQQSYRRKMAELESDWEARALRFRSRIEYMRILEDRRERWNKLSGYLTAQGELALFSHLAITSADNQVIFRFGPGAQSLPEHLAHPGTASWHFQAEDNALFRVFFQPIWLGEAEGMGHLVLFLPLDNALLYRNAAAETDLFLLWGERQVASSLGPSGEAAKLPAATDGWHTVKQARERWLGSGDEAPELLIRHAHTAPFSLGELAAGGLLALAALIGALWAVQGWWMLRLSRRIAALGKASEEFAHGHTVSAQLQQLLDNADDKREDEISQVAHSLSVLTVVVMKREAELRESETRMRDSEQRFRQLFNCSNDVILALELLPGGHPGTFLEANDMACERLGYSREELLRMNPGDIEAPEPGRARIPGFLRKLREKCQVIIERVHVAKDGRHFPVEISLHLFTLAGKDALLAVARDVSERRQAEDKLKESHNLLRTIIDTAPVRIFWKDRESRYLGCNVAFATDAGEAEPDHLIGKDDFQLGWKDQAELYRADDRRVMESGAPKLFYDEVQTTPDGRQIWLRTSKVPLRNEQSNEVIGVLGVYEDITTHKQTQLALTEAKQSAERANSAKSEFLANMSHEIRTPMNAIIGLSELALGLDIPPKLHNYCAKIQTSSKALLSIINDILDYSKVEAGHLELEEAEFSLDKLLENISDLFIVRAEEKGLELFFETAFVPPLLVGDALRLGQVMNNLVGNAVKFTEAGEIHVKVEEVAMEGTFATLRFSVRDTGIGMSTKQLQRLFLPFTQADGSITRRYGGTGLGLTISRRLVEKMGGDIAVTSESGRGSIFAFTIRLRVAPATAISRSAANLRGMRVLVVDDSATSRLILREILTSWKFVVAEAASGPQALEILRHARDDKAIELVLLDWKMPSMDGVEVARKIQEQVHNGEIPGMPVSIMVTAYSKDQLLQEAQGVRLDAVLQKPVIASNLFDTIVRIQGGEVERVPAPAFKIATSLAGATILLVEDNEINQLVAVGMLERAGMVVTVTNNGEEALQALQKETFDAVLMDLQMPVMDGFEATRRIRQDTRFHDMPILAMTAAVMARDRAGCLAAGMNDHVAKPVVPQELIATLMKWIRPGARNFPECRVIAIAREAAHAMPELPGFDLNAALERVGGNRILLEKLLMKFSGELGQVAGELDGLIRADRKNEAAAYLHWLKGAAGNLGAFALKEAADRLEREIREERVLGGRKEFNVALAHALDSIASIKQLPVTEPAEFDCEKCRWQRGAELFKSLRQLLLDNEFVPHETLAELQDSVECQVLRNKLQELQRQVDSIDYVHALETLDGVSCAKGHDFSGRCHDAN